jgi:hypothetical protein
MKVEHSSTSTRLSALRLSADCALFESAAASRRYTGLRCIVICAGQRMSEARSRAERTTPRPPSCPCARPLSSSLSRSTSSSAKIGRASVRPATGAAAFAWPRCTTGTTTKGADGACQASRGVALSTSSTSQLPDSLTVQVVRRLELSRTMIRRSSTSTFGIPMTPRTSDILLTCPCFKRSDIATNVN